MDVEEVDEVAVDKLDEEIFRRDYFRGDRPLAIRGGVKHWPAVGRWSRDYFESLFGSRKVPIDYSSDGFLTYTAEQGRNAKRVEIYDARRAGEPDPLLPLGIQYKDFSEWQNGQDFNLQENYWLTRLSDAPEEIRLPFDFHPGGDREFEAAVATQHLRGDVLVALRTLAQAKETTLANLLLALFKLFLFRLTKQEDLCVGVNVANRNHTDLENLIGFFVNLLPIRTRLSSHMSFDDLLDTVSGAAVEAYDHQDYPFDLMVQKLNPNRTAGGLPIVNVLFAFQNFVDVHVEVTAINESMKGDTGLRIETFPLSFKTSKFDLTLLAVDDEDRLDLHVEFDAALFKQETIQNYLNTLCQFAATVAQSHPLAKPQLKPEQTR